MGYYNYCHFIRFIVFVDITSIYLFVLLCCRLNQIIKNSSHVTSILLSFHKIAHPSIAHRFGFYRNWISFGQFDIFSHSDDRSRYIDRLSCLLHHNQHNHHRRIRKGSIADHQGHGSNTRCQEALWPRHLSKPGYCLGPLSHLLVITHAHAWLRPWFSYALYIGSNRKVIFIHHTIESTLVRRDILFNQSWYCFT